MYDIPENEQRSNMWSDHVMKVHANEMQVHGNTNMFQWEVETVWIEKVP